MTVVITPVGTSLFTNGAKNDNDIANYFEEIKEHREFNWDEYSSYIKPLKTRSERFIRDQGASASAELQSTHIILKKLGNDIKVHLLASDTIASRLAAEILACMMTEVLNDDVCVEFNCHEDVIQNLQVENAKTFAREGMPNLFGRINSIHANTGGSRNLAINITGGYSATLPYLTIFAQLNHVPLYYNFEDTEELITIPQAPLAIDWALIERYSDVISQIEKGIEQEKWECFKHDNYQAIEVLESFIWEDEIDGKVGSAILSPVGDIFWNHYRRCFVVDLAKNSYHDNAGHRANIDKAIVELYKRLDNTLRPDYFEPGCCYERLRSPETGGHNSDLNHTGQVQGQDIFVFKSTDHEQIRLMYTFEVSDNEITRLRIFDIVCRHMETGEYAEWKRQFENPAYIDFVTHTFEIPSEILAKIR